MDKSAKRRRKDTETRFRLVQNYIRNCFLLLVPVMIWNSALANQLPPAFQPEVFWHGIPTWLTYGENGSRILLFALAGLMPLSFSTRAQENGYYLYLAGLLIYFCSWQALIYFPVSAWSTSLPGFMAPAYTPVFWLTGISLIGRSFYFDIPFRRWWFALTALLFLVFHCIHAYTIYCRLY